MGLSVNKLFLAFALFFATCHFAQSLRLIRILKSSSSSSHSFYPMGAPVKLRASPASKAPENVILLNDTKGVPFTREKSGLSSDEYESDSVGEKVEEGVGPAVAFGSDYRPASPLEDEDPLSVSDENDTGNKDKQDLKVVYSDVHPTYVKPPNDFQPIIYPNRRVDGVRPGTALSANLPTLKPPAAPYPYPYPHGVSSWVFGGNGGLQRGSFWEDLAKDEALNSQPEVKVRSSYPRPPPAFGSPKRFKVPMSIPSWAMFPPNYFATFAHPSPFPSMSAPFPSMSTRFPSFSSSYQYSFPSPLQPTRNLFLPAYRPPLPPPPSSVSHSKATPKRRVSTPSGIKTQVPVGLSSWLFGGTRDLNAKHWGLPELVVEKIDMVPLLNSASAASSSAQNRKDHLKELMSRGEVETFDPIVVSVMPGEVEEETSGSASGTHYKPFFTAKVFFDDEEPDNYNTVNILN